MSKAKLISIVVLAILGLIVILQNTAAVETKILFFTITMPRAVLLICTALIGFVIGALVAFQGGKRKAGVK